MVRYSRHIDLREVGPSGQRKLSKAKVLVVGAGGLGVPVLLYLTAAGVGRLGIVDPDRISVDNLQRQVLYREIDLKKMKAEVAQELLQARNSEIDLRVYPVPFSLDNALHLVESYDVVVDCTDNFRTRYLINDACVKQDKPLVFAAIYKFEGQLGVFNFQHGPTYRCLFPKPPQAGEVPNCEDNGVLGVLPGVMGMYQANEVLKIILGLGNILSGILMTVNLLTLDQKRFTFMRNEADVNRIKNRPLQAVEIDDCKLF
ncbi:MAG: HesA/MoeB/ThiF family protein [Flavobacteriaceae bacterium]